MPISLREMELAASSPVHDHVTIEYWGESAGEGFFQNTGVLGTVSMLLPTSNEHLLVSVVPQPDHQN